MLNNPPKKQEMWVRLWVVRSPEKDIATHSSTTAWEIPQTEDPGGLQFKLKKKSDDLATKNSNIFTDNEISIILLHLLNS